MAARFIAACAVVFALAGSAQAASLEALTDRSSGRMFALRVTPSSSTAGAYAAKPSPTSLRATADAFIAGNRELIGIEEPARDLVATPATTDQLGLSRVRYLQTYRGLDVLGGEVAVHLNRDGQVTYVKTKVARELPAETTPRFAEAQAQDAALDAAVAEGASLGALMIQQTRLLVLPLGIVRNEPAEDTHLAWEVVVADAETGGERFAEAHYVDAITGAHLLRLSLIQHFDAVTRQIYGCGAEGNAGSGACHLDVESATFPGYFQGRSEGQPVRGPYPQFPGASGLWGSMAVDSLYELAGQMHNWVSTTFGINGANGQGGLARYPQAPAQITRVAANPDLGVQGGPVCPDALFGHTFGTIYMCRAVTVHDVFGHEYAHGIVYHSFHDGAAFPIGAISGGQSGALNEGFADVIGEVFEHEMTGSTDWRDGTAPPLPPVRDLADPHARSYTYGGPPLPFPDRFHDATVYCGGSDQGGVHINSTIPSHAFYLIAEGGTHNGCTIVGQGKDVAIQIFFRGWRTYFSREPSFNEAYADLIQASTDLYPAGVTAEVTKALQAVEMDQPGLCSGLPASQPPCSVVGVSDTPLPVIEGIRLLGQHPTGGNVRFAYRIPRDGRVEVRVHDLAGRLVARPVRAYQLAGDQLGAWDGRLEGGQVATAGTYFMTLTLDGEPIGARKLVMMR